MYIQKGNQISYLSTVSRTSRVVFLSMLDLVCIQGNNMSINVASMSAESDVTSLDKMPSSSVTCCNMSGCSNKTI